MILNCSGWPQTHASLPESWDCRLYHCLHSSKVLLKYRKLLKECRGGGKLFWAVSHIPWGAYCAPLCLKSTWWNLKSSGLLNKPCGLTTVCRTKERLGLQPSAPGFSGRWPWALFSRTQSVCSRLSQQKSRCPRAPALTTHSTHWTVGWGAGLEQKHTSSLNPQSTAHTVYYLPFVAGKSLLHFQGACPNTVCGFARAAGSSFIYFPIYNTLWTFLK